MKKIILLFSAIFAFTVTNAQDAAQSQKADVNSRATAMTSQMQETISLTADQQTKVQALNIECLKLMDLNLEKAKNDPNQMAAERKRISDKWEQDLNGILTPEQMTKWKNRNSAQK